MAVALYRCCGVPAPPRPSLAVGSICLGYAWIGQELRYCDSCGEPFWEHTHVRELVRETGPFFPVWSYAPIGPVTAERVRKAYARQCRG